MEQPKRFGIEYFVSRVYRVPSNACHTRFGVMKWPSPRKSLPKWDPEKVPLHFASFKDVVSNVFFDNALLKHPGPRSLCVSE